MKNLLTVLLVFISFNLISQTKVTKNLGDFKELKVYNGIEVELIKGSKQYLEITGEKSEMVKIKNVDNTLKLSLPFSLKPEDNAAEGKVLITLYYSKTLPIVDANEGAIITAKNFNQNRMELRAQERAYINITTKAKYVTVRATSGGIVKLSGTATNQDISADLYGVYHGFGLQTKSTNVKSGTGAKAEVYVTEDLDAKVKFGGTIFYKGSPNGIKEKKVVGGIIKKKDS